ncbi:MULTISPECIES: glycine-rich domain-containing protein [Rhodomicrobium]|uniref:glycine-rich domain-containing protein n=1 Tax=Rhodomicrobium TaxID=1068 RepID=UPI000F73682E|nr:MULTISPECIES: hypothetical protein [Rhodomicrobium]
MPRDGFGSYSTPNTFLPNTVMSATAVNQNFTDAGTALTGSLARDGQSSMTGQFKAAAGTLGAPGIAFGVDTDTGFRRASEDEMRWVGGGQDRFYIDSTGKAFLLGDLNVGGDVGLSAPIVIATTSASLLTLRRTENDTTPRTVEEYRSGSGAGAKADLQVVGDGNNAVVTARWRVNSASVFQATSSLFTHNVDTVIGANMAIDTDGFIDFSEIAEPSAPASNVARLFCVDVDGQTRLAFKNSSGAVAYIPSAMTRQQFDSAGTWNKPASGTIAFIQAWGAGGSGGRAGSGDGGGGGGGGCYSERYVALASLSNSVSVTVGAGGAAQTSDNTDGNPGGDSSFGAYLLAYGGGAGNGDGTDNGGGGGGGLTAAGSNGSGASGGAGGGPVGTIGGTSTAAANNSNPFGGGGGASSGSAAGGGLYGGGGGGFGSAAGSPTAGGFSVFGGGGGGGGADSSAGAAGGTAIIYGGNGGAGTIDTNVAVSGTAPGGGGGGSENANSGAGAAGRVIVMVW